MAFNVLTGSVSTITTIIASGSFTGSFGGDGAQLENVKQFDLYNNSAGRLVMFKTVGGETHLEGDASLFYNTTTDTLTLSNLTASSGVKFSGLTEASASAEKYLALDTNNNIVLTSSSGGGGSGTVTIQNDANNRLTTADGSGGIVGESNLTFNGNFLSLQGGLVLKRRIINAAITASNTDYFIGISASSDIDITLPDASTLTSGQTFVFKDELGTANAHTININASASQTIDGESTIKLESPYSAINIYTDGTSKYFIF